MLRPDFDFQTFLPLTAAARLNMSGRPVVFEPGQALFQQGDDCAGIYLINSGIVGLRLLDEAGDSALLSLCKSGGMLGYAAFLAEGAHAVTAEVLTISRIRFIDRESVGRLCDSDQRVREYLVQAAIGDLNRSQGRCASLLIHGLKKRLIDLILSFSSDALHTSDMTDRIIHLPIQRKDLAALIGAAPESLSRLISKLEGEGLLKFEGREVRLSRALLIQTPPEAVEFEHPDAQSMLALLMEARTALLTLIETNDREAWAELEQKVERASAALDALLQKKARHQAQLAASFAAIWEDFKTTRRTEIIPAVHAGKTHQAKKIAMGIQAERIGKKGCLEQACGRCRLVAIHIVHILALDIC